MEIDKYPKTQAATADDALLSAFFAEARKPIADNGFTDRVMDALAERSWQEVSSEALAEEGVQLRRWSEMLNITGALACLALLVYLGFFVRMWDSLHTFIYQVVAWVMTFDAENLLVHAMLFLHRLPELLPSPTQMFALGVAFVILMGLALHRFFRNFEENGRKLGLDHGFFLPLQANS